MHYIEFKNMEKLTIDKLFHIAGLLESGLANSNKLLAGQTWLLFFPESSIRTRITFEKAVTDLGGQTILFPPSTLDKKELLKDVIGYAENWVDGIIVRHSELSKIHEMALNANIPIINAMTSENHPCEILTDLYALSRLKPDYLKLTYTFVGESSNISKTWTSAANILSFKLNHVCTEGNRIEVDGPYYRFSTDLESVIPETDVFLTDGLPSENKHENYYKNYQITHERLKRARPNVLLNPCPPFTRGEEVSIDAIDSEYFVGYEFKKALLWVQQAILLHCSGIEI